MLRFILVTLFSVFVSTAGVAQQSVAQEEAQLVRRILDRSESDPVLATIRDKIWVREIYDAPLRYFINKDLVTEADKPALERWWDISQENARDVESFFRKHAPSHISILEAMRAALFTNFVNLYEGKITFGDYHVKRRELTAKFREAMAERNKEVAARQSEVQSYALNSYLNFLIAQGYLNSRQQPTVVAPPNIIYDVHVNPPLNITPPPMPGVIRR